MSNVETRLASALLSVAASLALVAVPNGAARAADSCITEPKAEAPQGKHWYYRIERGTARHCWYLRGEDEASARTPGAEPVAAANPTPVPSSRQGRVPTTTPTPSPSVRSGRIQRRPLRLRLHPPLRRRASVPAPVCRQHRRLRSSLRAGLRHQARHQQSMPHRSRH